jgi:hypothetical protein
MVIFKIPYGWDPVSKQWKEAGKVSSGLACGCLCHICGKLLQAVHRRRPFHSYFRHHVLGECAGALESLYHLLAKDVLERNSWVLLPTGERFYYNRCDVETRLHGKRPDIRLINLDTGDSLIVEIFFSHRIERSTLTAFRDNGERVMEIDISNLRKIAPSLTEFEELILEKAPRSYLSIPVEVAASKAPFVTDYGHTQQSPVQKMLGWLAENWLIVVAVLIGAIFIWHHYRRRRDMRYNFIKWNQSLKKNRQRPIWAPF